MDLCKQPTLTPTSPLFTGQWLMLARAAPQLSLAEPELPVCVLQQKQEVLQMRKGGGQYNYFVLQELADFSCCRWDVARSQLHSHNSQNCFRPTGNHREQQFPPIRNKEKVKTASDWSERFGERIRDIGEQQVATLAVTPKKYKQVKSGLLNKFKGPLKTKRSMKTFLEVQCHMFLPSLFYHTILLHI